MTVDYESRLRTLEAKLDKLLAYRDDINIIRKIIKFIKKNKKYFRFSIDVLLFISTILGLFII